MILYDCTTNESFEASMLPEKRQSNNELFIICRTYEVPGLCGIFDFDESTIIEGNDLDESVRYASFEGYDFVSMVHIEILGSEFHQQEVNLYVSSRYLVIVMPDRDSVRLAAMEKKLLSAAKNARERGTTGRICQLYFSVFHNMLADFSASMEMLEDQMQALSEEIISHANGSQFSKINHYKNIAYALKKQLRALSYLGEQILLDENKLISKSQIHYFRNVNTRLKKLYDFAESLYNLGSEIVYTYDSRLTMKTNDTVNKLTAYTLFFGPLTVITGIYGMNFTFMPELNWKLGYPLAIVIMAAISGLMYFVLKKKRWL